MEEGACLRHLAKKNVPAGVTVLSEEWVDTVERMSGVAKLAKLEQAEKRNEIQDQPAQLDVPMEDGRPWRVLIPTEIHPHLVGLRSDYFSILPRREFLNGQKIQKILSMMMGQFSPYIGSTMLSGNDYAVVGNAKMCTKLMLNSQDGDSRIKPTESMHVGVQTCEQDTTPPMKGIIKKLQYKPRGPDTAQAEQSHMRRRHQEEEKKLEETWTGEHRTIMRNLKTQKRAALEQEQRQRIRGDKLAAKRGDAAGATAEDVNMTNSLDSGDSQNQMSQGLNAQEHLAAQMDVDDLLESASGQQRGEKLIIDDYSEKLQGYEVRKKNQQAVHKSEAKDMTDRVAAASADKFSLVKISEDRNIVVRQDKITCDADYYRFVDEPCEIFCTAAIELQNMTVVPVEIPVVFECSMVEPAFLKQLAGSEIVMQFKASGTQGPPGREVDLVPITMEMSYKIPASHLTADARTALADENEAVGKVLAHTKCPVFRNSLKSDEDGLGLGNEAAAAALAADAADQSDTLEIKNGAISAPSRLIPRDLMYDYSLWDEQRALGPHRLTPLDDVAMDFRREHILYEAGSRELDWRDETDEKLEMPEPGLYVQLPDNKLGVVPFTPLAPLILPPEQRAADAVAIREQQLQDMQNMRELHGDDGLDELFAEPGAGAQPGQQGAQPPPPEGDVEMGEAARDPPAPTSENNVSTADGASGSSANNPPAPADGASNLKVSGSAPSGPVPEMLSSTNTEATKTAESAAGPIVPDGRISGVLTTGPPAGPPTRAGSPPRRDFDGYSDDLGFVEVDPAELMAKQMKAAPPGTWPNTSEGRRAYKRFVEDSSVDDLLADEQQTNAGSSSSASCSASGSSSASASPATAPTLAPKSALAAPPAPGVGTNTAFNTLPTGQKGLPAQVVDLTDVDLDELAHPDVLEREKEMENALLKPKVETAAQQPQFLRDETGREYWMLNGEKKYLVPVKQEKLSQLSQVQEEPRSSQLGVGAGPVFSQDITPVAGKAGTYTGATDFEPEGAFVPPAEEGTELDRALAAAGFPIVADDSSNRKPRKSKGTPNAPMKRGRAKAAGGAPAMKRSKK
eukprot:g10418.t1